jgi:hypothetical protein
MFSKRSTVACVNVILCDTASQVPLNSDRSLINYSLLPVPRADLIYIVGARLVLSRMKCLLFYNTASFSVETSGVIVVLIVSKTDFFS